MAVAVAVADLAAADVAVTAMIAGADAAAAGRRASSDGAGQSADSAFGFFSAPDIDPAARWR